MAAKSDFRDLSVPELEATFKDLSRKLFQLRSEPSVGGKIEKPHLVRETRRDIARVLTNLRMKSQAPGKVT